MFSRRGFLKFLASTAALNLSGCLRNPGASRFSARVVVVGGGFAGATVAKYLRLLDSSIHVTLIESKKRYITCPGSNWVLAGLRHIDSLAVEYQQISARYGVNVVHDTVTAIDAGKKQVRVAGRDTFNYDRLVVAPGIDFLWDAVEGYNSATAEYIPHAWQAGRQTEILWRQVQAMPENGTIVISAPANPFRCPPGPYERASMLAWFCKQHKPKAKIIIVDHKRGFSKQTLFFEGWKKHYGYGTAHSVIEWQSIADNPVIAVGAKSRTLITDFGDKISADVLNLIPPQQAGAIARQSGLTDSSGWCPVKPLTQESTMLPYVHVLGDAARQQPMPKSAFAANSAAKNCASAIVALLHGKMPDDPAWMNACYSLLTPDQAISIAMVYKANMHGRLVAVPGAGGVSQRTDSVSLALEAHYARDWLNSIVTDSFN